MNADRNDALRYAFGRAWGGSPDLLIRAPGRVNLIGEHTDYSEGFVLPMAIDYDIRIAARARPDRQVRIYAVDFDDRDAFSLDDIQRTGVRPSWADYVRGVAHVLQQEGYRLRGMDAAIAGNVPLGAGLSSSAALEVSTIAAFRTISRLTLDGVRAALIGQRAENEFVGMHCGIMDQFIAALARPDHALLIDCRTLDHQQVPLPAGVRIVITDSGVRRGLVDSAYNERRAQCEEGARLMGVPALRDASTTLLDRNRDRLPLLVARRCRHVVDENERVLNGVSALQRGDLVAFGELMNASHASMRDLFEITTPEIDSLVEIQRQIPGCLGVRMTGGGFGGCTVALVEEGAMAILRDAIYTRYPVRTGRRPSIYVSRATGGAERLS